jgi:hypothetical protein
LKKAMVLCIGLCVLWFFIGIGIELYFAYNLPSVMNVEGGQINRLVVNHGSVRFGTDRESNLIKMMRDGFPIAGFGFALALLAGLKLGIFQTRGEAPIVEKPSKRPQK